MNSIWASKINSLIDSVRFWQRKCATVWSTGCRRQRAPLQDCPDCDVTRANLCQHIHARDMDQTGACRLPAAGCRQECSQARAAAPARATSRRHAPFLPRAAAHLEAWRQASLPAAARGLQGLRGSAFQRDHHTAFYQGRNMEGRSGACWMRSARPVPNCNNELHSVSHAEHVRRREECASVGMVLPPEKGGGSLLLSCFNSRIERSGPI